MLAAFPKATAITRADASAAVVVPFKMAALRGNDLKKKD
jgi:hypothetical protein